jgi:uncharacterized protein with von Willebrand factor type A (vWA) domain
MAEAHAFAANVLLFGRLLRRAGVDVHHSRVLEAMRALADLGLRRRADVHATLRALLVHRHEDLARFDAAFALFFRPHRSGEGSPLALFALGERARVVVRPDPGTRLQVEFDDLEARDTADATRAVGAYSTTAVSRTKDFADFTPQELQQAGRVLAALPWRLGRRRTRRWERRGSHALDLRPLLRRSVTRGELTALSYRRRRTAPRPIVVLGDVSGSMERYSRLLLHFAWGLARQARHVEAFVFSTTLTRITRRTASGGDGRAAARAIRDVADWGGGTRIGEALRLFNTRWARRVMRHGPVVILVSDGWDRGDPAQLARELARVRRSCRRLVWLNPLLGRAGYQPLTRGMQAALPFVTDFLPAHNLASLEQLAALLAEDDDGRRSQSRPEGPGFSPARATP